MNAARRLERLERRIPPTADRCPACPSVGFAYQDHPDDPVMVVCIVCGRPAQKLVVFTYEDRPDKGDTAQKDQS